MIIWLASYPRSGNTLLRTILRSNFGLHSYSLYDDLGDIARTDELRSAVGHLVHGEDEQTFYKRAVTSPETFFVKTHDAPLDDSKAIYVVRDGRSASVSYFHYVKSFAGSAFSLEDIIVGSCRFGSWSQHIYQWAPDKRPNTLLLRYEDLVFDPSKAINEVARFIDRTPITTEPQRFSSLNALNPEFFRAGSDVKNINELTGNEAKLFWVLHHHTMNAMGYEIAREDLSIEFAAELASKLSNLKAESRRAEEFEIRCNQMNQYVVDLENTRWWRAGCALKRYLSYLQRPFRTS